MNVSGVTFFPLEPKKQRSKKKIITPDLRLLPHRLSKRQSLLTTVLFRTTFTRTIKLNLLLK